MTISVRPTFTQTQIIIVQLSCLIFSVIWVICSNLILCQRLFNAQDFSMQLSVEIYLKFPLRYDNFRTTYFNANAKLATIATFILNFLCYVGMYVVI